jgi:hypothetical protein
MRHSPSDKDPQPQFATPSHAIKMFPENIFFFQEPSICIYVELVRKELNEYTEQFSLAISVDPCLNMLFLDALLLTNAF